MEPALILAVVMMIGIATFVLYGCIVSLLERENRAAVLLFLSGLVLIAPLILLFTFQQQMPQWLLIALPLLYVLTLVLFFAPVQWKLSTSTSKPNPGYDERKIMFSRNELKPGTERFKAYYRDYPEHLLSDEQFRKKPGLLDEKALYFDPFLFNAAKASFDAVEAFHGIVDGPVNGQKTECDPKELTAFLKSWAKKLGAKDVAITLLKDYHKYETVGRGKDYGKSVRLNHKYAIALTVEMDKDLIDTAPKGPVTLETSHKYLESGEVAVQLAVFLRKLGHEARAHIDGNYRVICPLVAKDAGLGNIGRMGLLMTPGQGPRVRIAVVTTDAPLELDARRADPSMTAFCRVCKKCAENCPSRAIPFDDEQTIGGVKRWQINQEKCFTYWCQAGTDCGKCVAVCPYSHPDNLFHNLVRYEIRYNPLFRSVAAKLDDVFYGKKPAPKPGENNRRRDKKFRLLTLC